MAELFYYCLVHRAVEPADSGCRAEDRLGPYPTRAQAEQALASVAERNEAWDNDPRWNDDADSAGDGEQAGGSTKPDAP